MILLVLKTVVGTYQSVVKRSHDNDDFSASLPTGDGWRVIEAWSAMGYRRWSKGWQWNLEI